jgi:hypothetical protein
LETTKKSAIFGRVRRIQEKLTKRLPPGEAGDRDTCGERLAAVSVTVDPGAGPEETMSPI